MPSRGSKIKELAKDLGVSAKLLVERCRAEGIVVQNSVSRLTAQEERVVRSWFEEGREKESE
jgi:hypothetical protein